MSLDNKKFWTGVGSRETPKDILSLMVEVARKLSHLGWILRSGGAEGADTAFEIGALDKGAIVLPEIYIPWVGFNNHDVMDRGIILPQKDKLWQQAQEMASEIHPAWDKCSSAAKTLHSRNVFQVLGQSLDTPSNFLICYAKPSGNSITGGTRTAYELAKKHNVPCFNLYFDEHRERVDKFVNIEV